MFFPIGTIPIPTLIGADSLDLLTYSSDIGYGGDCFGVIFFYVILLPDVHPFPDADRWIAVIFVHSNLSQTSECAFAIIALRVRFIFSTLIHLFGDDRPPCSLSAFPSAHKFLPSTSIRG